MTARHSSAISVLAMSGAVAVLAGCTGPVILRHPETGKTVQCSPDDTNQRAEIVYQRERDCIEAYQRQGYRRVSH